MFDLITALVLAVLAPIGVLTVKPVRSRKRPARRLDRLDTRAGLNPMRNRSAAADSGRPRLGVRRWVVASLVAVAVAVSVGGWVGVLLAAAAGFICERGLRRLDSGRRIVAEAEAADLPLAADLLAVALRGGAPLVQAVNAVADALPGALGDRLARVARMLALGATPDQAWRELWPVPGARRLVRAVIASAEHGGALAAALTRLADDLRADRLITADAAARRAGVLIVLPLGLCFLPAFMLAGLVPVIVAVLGDVL